MPETILYEVAGRVAIGDAQPPREAQRDPRPSSRRTCWPPWYGAAADPGRARRRGARRRARGLSAGYDVTVRRDGRQEACRAYLGRAGDASLRGWLRIWDLPTPGHRPGPRGHASPAARSWPPICDVTFVADDARVGTPAAPAGRGLRRGLLGVVRGAEEGQGGVLSPPGRCLGVAEVVAMGLFNRAVPAASPGRRGGRPTPRAVARTTQGPARAAEAVDRPNAGRRSGFRQALLLKGPRSTPLPRATLGAECEPVHRRAWSARSTGRVRRGNCPEKERRCRRHRPKTRC